MVAYLSQHGLHGEFSFSQYTSSLIQIESSLETTLQYPDQVWSWGITQFPVDYTDVSIDRCSEARLGKEVISFDKALGYLTLPGNDSTMWHAEATLTGIRT